jgi:septal ring factor EnvC (AmiA/AmiB activator)
VRASRTGRVAVAARHLQGLGPTVILDHGDGYVSVYAGLDQLLVSPGVRVEQGNPVGRLAGDPLYFEIRYQTRLSDPLRLLP